jgi:hypothetical protein
MQLKGMFKVKMVLLQRLGVWKNETIDKTLANFTKQNAQQKGKRKNKEKGRKFEPKEQKSANKGQWPIAGTLNKDSMSFCSKNTFS